MNAINTRIVNNGFIHYTFLYVWFMLDIFQVNKMLQANVWIFIMNDRSCI